MADTMRGSSNDGDDGQPDNPTADQVMQSTEDNQNPTNEISSNQISNTRDPSNQNVTSSRHHANTIRNTMGEMDRAGHNDAADGLFGSGSEDERADPTTDMERKLDDEELDSGDDEDRNDRMEEDDMDGYGNEAMETTAQQETTVLDLNLGRHATPHPSDGQVSLLKFPNHLGIEPKNFQLKDFQPPTTDHHSSAAPSTTFSAHEVARNTIRWRYSPNDPTTLQSNARFLYWSDGSTTLQLASNPTVQYLLPAKPLAPIQRNPTKPHSTGTNRVQIANGTSTYNASLDSHTYLTDPHEHASFLRITNHITTSITVQSTTDIDDEATARLQESLAAAVRGNKTAPDGGVGMININEDPELAKKKAEVAERDKLRAQRRRQNQEERERDRANRVLGRSGLRAGGIGAGGLTIGGLEDDDGMAATRPRATKPTRKPRRRNSEYSDDEEDYRNRGRTKEDEYDEDDGFLVGSDEEPEVVQDESEEEEALDDDGDGAAAEKPRKGRKKGGTEGDGGRSKKRRVVEDEDEE